MASLPAGSLGSTYGRSELQERWSWWSHRPFSDQPLESSSEGWGFASWTDLARASAVCALGTLLQPLIDLCMVMQASMGRQVAIAAQCCCAAAPRCPKRKFRDEHRGTRCGPALLRESMPDTSHLHQGALRPRVFASRETAISALL